MESAIPTGRPGRGIDDLFVSTDVPYELARLRASPEYAREGHAGRTVTKYPEQRVVVEAMKAGARLPMHETEEELTLQLVLGQLRVWMPFGGSFELSEGSLAAVDAGRIHELEALQDCGFVLTLAWPPMARREGGGGEGQTEGSGI